MSDNLLWVDMETTGLDPNENDILEIALVVTDASLRELAYYQSLVRPACEIECTLMHPDVDEVVRKMHDASGLWDDLREAEEGNVPYDPWHVADEALEFVRRWFPEEKTAVLCGSTVSFDRNFLYYQMGDLEAHLHHRNVDVSSIKELCRRWNPGILNGVPQKTGNHRSLGDIRDSIAELRHYGKYFMLPNIMLYGG